MGILVRGSFADPTIACCVWTGLDNAAAIRAYEKEVSATGKQ